MAQYHPAPEQMLTRPTWKYYSLQWGLRWAGILHVILLIFTLIDLAFFTRHPKVVLGAPVEVILDKDLPFEPIPHGRHVTKVPLPPKITDQPSPVPPQKIQNTAPIRDIYQVPVQKGPRPLPAQKKNIPKPGIKPTLAGALKNLQDTTTRADNNHNVRQGSQSGVDSDDDALVATIMQQLKPCWNVDSIINAPNIESLVVTIRIHLKRDGTVTDATIISPKNPSDPFQIIAVNEAKNAVLDPRCQPLKLPSNKYDHWKSVQIIFDALAALQQ